MKFDVGDLESFKIGWNAHCRSNNIKQQTHTLFTFGTIHPRNFRVRDSYRYHLKKKRLDIRVRVTAGGHQRPGNLADRSQWNGMFKARTTVYDGHEILTKCSSPRISWRVGPTRR